MDEAQEREFAEFFAATWPRLSRVAYAVTGDRTWTEDVVQSALAKAYASWSRVRSADDPVAYVRRMVLNEVFGVRRRAWWKAERLVPEQPDDAVAGFDDGVADRDELWRALLDLAPRQRAVLVLRYYEDLSEQQIAQVLGCSRGTVKSQAYDALSTLRRRAGRERVNDGGRP